MIRIAIHDNLLTVPSSIAQGRQCAQSPELCALLSDIQMQYGGSNYAANLQQEVLQKDFQTLQTPEQVSLLRKQLGIQRRAPLRSILQVVEHEQSHNKKSIDCYSAFYELIPLLKLSQHEGIKIPTLNGNIKHQIETRLTELISNAIDASTQNCIGKFGSGFMSTLNLLYSGQASCIIIISKTKSGNISRTLFTLVNGDIWVGTTIECSDAMQDFMKTSGTLIQVESTNIDVPILLADIEKTFQTSMGTNIYINGNHVNNLNEMSSLKELPKTKCSHPVHIDTHQNTIFIRDSGVGMDEELILTKLIYPKAGTKQPLTYNKQELQDIVNGETNYIYLMGESEHTTVRFQIAGVKVKEIQIPKQGDISDFTLVLPSITYLPESRNEIKLTEEVFATVCYMLSQITNSGKDIKEIGNLLGCLCHLIRSFDIGHGAANRMGQELKKMIANQVVPAIMKQAEKEGKVVVQLNSKLEKCLHNNHNIIYLDSLFIPKLEIDHIPGVEKLENIVLVEKRLISPNRYCADFDPSSEVEVLVLPQIILINKKYVHTDFQHAIVNNLVNFSNGYEIESERANNGFLVNLERKKIIEQSIGVEEQKNQQNKQAIAQAVYKNLIVPIDEHFDGLLSDTIKRVLSSAYWFETYMQKYIIEPFDRSLFLDSPEHYLQGTQKVLWHLVTCEEFEYLRQDEELEELFTQTCSKLKGSTLHRFFSMFWSMSHNITGDSFLIAPELKHLLKIVIQEADSDDVINNILLVLERFDKPIKVGDENIIGRHIFQELIQYRKNYPTEQKGLNIIEPKQKKLPLALSNSFGPLHGCNNNFPKSKYTYPEQLVMLLQYYASLGSEPNSKYLIIEEKLKEYFGFKFDLQVFAIKHKELISSMDMKSLKMRRGGRAIFRCFENKFNHLNQKGKTMLYESFLDPQAITAQQVNNELEKDLYYQYGAEGFNKKYGYKKGRPKKSDKRSDKMIDLREGKAIDIEDIAEAPWQFLQQYAQLEDLLRQSNERCGTYIDPKSWGGYFEPMSLRNRGKENLDSLHINYQNPNELLMDTFNHLLGLEAIPHWIYEKCIKTANHFGFTLSQLEEFANTNKKLILAIHKGKKYKDFDVAHIGVMCKYMTKSGKTALLDLLHSGNLTPGKIIKKLQDPSYRFEGKALFIDYKTNKPALWRFKHDDWARAGMLMKLEQLLLEAKLKLEGEASKGSEPVISFNEYCSQSYPQEITSMVDLLSQENQYLGDIESLAKLSKRKTHSIKLSELSFLYNNYNPELANSSDTKEFRIQMKKLKMCNQQHYHQMIRSTIDGQDRGSMIFLRELINNSRDAILSQESTGDNCIEVVFGQEHTEGERYRVTRIQDNVGMSFNHVLQYLLPINVSSKSGDTTVGMHGQGFYSAALGAKEIRIKTSTGDGNTNYWKLTPIWQSSGSMFNNQIIDFDIEWQEAKEVFKGTIIERVAQIGESSVETLGTIGIHYLHKYVGGVKDVAIYFNGKALNTKAGENKIGGQSVHETNKNDDNDTSNNLGEVSLVIRPDLKSVITKDDSFVMDMDPILLAPFPGRIRELIYEKGWSFDLPPKVILNKTRNAIVDSKHIYPLLQQAIRPLILEHMLVLVCKKDLKIPMLPEDYFYNPDYKKTESANPEIEDLITMFNIGNYKASLGHSLMQDKATFCQFITGLPFELEGDVVTLRKLRDSAVDGYIPEGIQGRILEQINKHERQKKLMKKVLKGTKSNKFENYKDLKSLSKALGINETRVIAFFTYCHQLAKQIGVEAKLSRSSFDGNPTKAVAIKSEKKIVWSTDDINELRKLIEGFDNENSLINQNVINTVIHECTHFMEADEKRGSHESEQEESNSFSYLMIKLLTKLLRTTVQDNTTS